MKKPYIACAIQESLIWGSNTNEGREEKYMYWQVNSSHREGSRSAGKTMLQPQRHKK